MALIHKKRTFEIDTLPAANGLIGLATARQKAASIEASADTSSDEPARDVADTVTAIAEWGAHLVVALATDHDRDGLAMAQLEDAVRAQHIDWLDLSFAQDVVPDVEWWHDWRAQSWRIHRALEHGDRVLIHGGDDRMAMLAALILCERGLRLPDALDKIKAARNGAAPLPQQLVAIIKNAPCFQGSEMIRGEGTPIVDAAGVRACLMGGAIGDATGAEIEFWTLPQIRRHFGGDAVTALPHDGQLGAITDDTQMTLFTAEGLIRAKERWSHRGICHAPSVVHHALLRWLVTQGDAPKMEVDRAHGLIADPRLHVCRAPGMTCLAALTEARRFGEVAENHSKGCGTIMRMAPVAFLGGSDPHQMAIDCSNLTHGHATAGASAAAFVDILMALHKGARIEAAARQALSLAEGETARAIQLALAAPLDGSPETVESLGGGWVAEEALSIAIYAARVAPDFATGIRIAVCHSGDSDSTGAIAGNMLGLIFRDQVLRHPLAEKIECADRIARLANDLALALDPCAHLPDDFEDRYPGA